MIQTEGTSGLGSSVGKGHSPVFMPPRPWTTVPGLSLYEQMKQQGS